MNIPWNEVWEAATGAAEDALKAKSPAARDFLRKTAEARQERLKLLLSALADGSLTEDTIQFELDLERLVLETELLALKVLAKKAAQDAANAFFAVIESALMKGIGLPA